MDKETESTVKDRQFEGEQEEMGMSIKCRACGLGVKGLKSEGLEKTVANSR